MTTPIGEEAKLIDLEQLQRLSYERSKLWATFLDNIAESENQLEIPLVEMDVLFGQISDDQDDLASMEDENYDDNVDPEVLRDITNSTRLALMIHATTNNNMVTQQLDTSANEGNNELIDLFNQTLPVINEHNRQMKESGFDRILNSFDAKKIEEKVGGWLRRHNSLCANDYTMTSSPVHNKRRETPCRMRNTNTIERLHRSPAYRATRPYKICRQEEDTDSDDSFNSGETARYIRSSRTGAMKNSSSTTMMIKTYRMVKSTRQALRDKYACEQDVDTDSHLDELRHRRRLAKELALRHRNEKQHSGRSHKPFQYQYMSPTHSTHSQRRKILRKRTASNGYSAADSSSESDSYYYDECDTIYPRKHQMCCNQRHCKYAPAPPPATPLSLTASVKRSQYRDLKKASSCVRNDRMYYYIQSHTHSMSSSPPSSNSFTRTDLKKPLKRLDNRPCRLESECRCCDEKRLCKDYKHLADTSTEEWIVENCYSPRKTQQEAPIESLPVTNGNLQKADKITTIHMEEVESPNLKKLPKQFQTKTIKKTIKDKLPPSKLPVNRMQLESPKPKKLTRGASRAPKTTTKDDPKKDMGKAPTEDSFEQELQMAIKLSEELYKNERRDMAKTQDQRAPMTQDEVANDHIFVKPATIISPSTFCQNGTIRGTEETFFAFSKAIYNSTTVDTDNTQQIAKSKEFNGSTEEQKMHEIPPTKTLRKAPPARIYREDSFEDDDETKKISKEDASYVDEDGRNGGNIISNSRRNVKTKKLRPETDEIEEEHHQHSQVKVGRIDDRSKSKSRQKVHTKKLRKETNEEAVPEYGKVEEKLSEVEKDDEDFVFAMPQARPKVNINTKNVSNVGSETTFFASSHGICNSTAKINNKHARKRQQDNDNDNEESIKSTTTQSEMLSFVTEPTLFKAPHAICNSTAKIVNKQAMQRQQTSDYQEDVNKEENIKSTKPNKKVQKKENLKRKAIKNMASAVSNSESHQSADSDKDFEMEERNVLVKQTSTTSSQTESNSMTDSSKATHKEKKNEILGRTKETKKKSKTHIEQCNSTDIPKKKQRCKRQISDTEANHEEKVKTTKEKTEHLSARALKKTEAAPLDSKSDASEDKTEYLEKEEECKQTRTMNMDNFTAEDYKDDSSCRQKQIDSWNGGHAKVSDNTTSKKTKSSQITKAKKTNNISNVSSTTIIHSPEIHRTAMANTKQSYRKLKLKDSSSERDDDDNDCTVVSSTTNLDHLAEMKVQTGKLDDTGPPTTSYPTHSSSQPLVTTQSSPSNVTIQKRQNKTLPSMLHHPKKGILIYAPQNSTLAPAHSFSNDGVFFNITQEHLSTIIGQKPAEKFLKYYIGRRRFNSKSTIYFRPPAVLDTSDASSSDSDDDDLEYIGRYGDLYESFGGSGGHGGGGQQHS